LSIARQAAAAAHPMGIQYQLADAGSGRIGGLFTPPKSTNSGCSGPAFVPRGDQQQADPGNAGPSVSGFVTSPATHA
jgi:hypothetical protein